ncbi:MAG TPA: NCS2 family permease [Candidatus Wallbacteria bacterium]|nr:NCS2 family permease [Candidatus Wallbacteria bacterium]
MKAITKFFELDERKSDIKTEIRAGFTVYLTMAYILFVNPMILKSAGVPFGACMVGTAISAGISCIIMGLFTNFPLALASGMGLNSMLAFNVILKYGISWQTGMGLIFLDGLVVLIMVVIGLREAVMNAIPEELKHAIAVGIGLFLAFIGFLNGGIVVLNKEANILMAGNFASAEVAVTLAGLLVISVLVSRRVKGGILIGIILNTVIAVILGVAKIPTTFISAPDFSTIGALDIAGAFKFSLVPVLISFVIVDFFDTLGTVTAIGYQANLTNGDGKIKNISRILGIDAIAAMLGGACGASSVTSYVESAAGVSEGGRSGLTVITTGILFLLSIFIAPIAGIVPKEATASALVIIGFMMMDNIVKIKFDEYETAIPAFIMFMAMPFTYSISHGIGMGFITYSILKIFAGKASQVHPLMYLTSAVFAVSFALFN